MCGIIGVLRPRPEAVEPVASGRLLASLATARELVESDSSGPDEWCRASQQLVALNSSLRSTAGFLNLCAELPLRKAFSEHLEVIDRALGRIESALDAGSNPWRARIELLNARLVELKDASWSVARDRLATAEAVLDLAGDVAHPAALVGLLSIQQALAALDRLEVRGRDSAGLQLFLSGHGLDLEEVRTAALLAARRDPLCRNGAVRVLETGAVFVYKTAAEIGELGDNVATLRTAIRGDELLARALCAATVEVAVLGHTRWASVGMINEVNAHPLDEREEPPRRGAEAVFAVLNGDVDNHRDLRSSEQLATAPEITTDAKVIPVLVSRRLAAGIDPAAAFRETVDSFIGSVAIASAVSSQPERLYLALRGSGQALYVGLGEDAFIVASEPYGVVEETSRFLRLDGETPANPDSPTSSRGQIVVVERSRAGHLDGLQRFSYDGTSLPIEAADLRCADITTRDVDRRSFRHYLLKEISEAPSSFAKTVRGKVRESDRGPVAELGEEALPRDIEQRLVNGVVRQIYVIGQGTAAVAGSGVARAIDMVVVGGDEVPTVTPLPATELSGFHLRNDMSDTLVIAISQSGTTTDTNRTVDLVRRRGAAVIAIVNRRHSDLTDKADGVLYTSDGRDIEMSVASTKAFYSQIAAGFLLAAGVARSIPGADLEAASELVRGLQTLPDSMTEVLDLSPEIAEIAAELAPPKRYWALVGNGWNRVAAEEIRIKLSELCYKSIACDATEDKKHIDLSAEPLILICASGLGSSNLEDVEKEVAIYRAHCATPVLIRSSGRSEASQAVATIEVPRAHPALAFVLSTVVGHLFGYHAALAIDELARPLRALRTALEELMIAPGPAPATSASPRAVKGDLLARLAACVAIAEGPFRSDLAAGRYDGCLSAGVAVDLASLMMVAGGSIPLSEYARRRSRPASPGALMEDLVGVATAAIEELTRPVDAIKHQAKTVTVGISRSEEALVTVPLVQAVLRSGPHRDRLAYQDLRALATLDPLVQEVEGYTRYSVNGETSSSATVSVVARSGVSLELSSRTDRDPLLKGTKRRVASEQRLLVARGERDGRLFILLPELDAGRSVGLLLLHVRLCERAPAAVLRAALRSYRDRYQKLLDAVLETEAELALDRLEDLDVEEALVAPIESLSQRWRTAGTSRTEPRSPRPG